MMTHYLPTGICTCTVLGANYCSSVVEAGSVEGDVGWGRLLLHIVLIAVLFNQKHLDSDGSRWVIHHDGSRLIVPIHHSHFTIPHSLFPIPLPVAHSPFTIRHPPSAICHLSSSPPGSWNNDHPPWPWQTITMGNNQSYCNHRGTEGGSRTRMKKAFVLISLDGDPVPALRLQSKGRVWHKRLGVA